MTALTMPSSAMVTATSAAKARSRTAATVASCTSRGPRCFPAAVQLTKGNRRTLIQRKSALAPGTEIPLSVDELSYDDYEGPVPTVLIDNLEDPLATVITLEFGDYLGELLDTIQSLKNLGLNVTRAEIKEGKKNRFFITDAMTSEKITASERLEEIRFTIIKNLMEYHPESIESLAMGFKRVVEGTLTSPLGMRKTRGVKTKISVSPVASGARSAVQIQTLDRPGLLVDIVSTLKDLSLNVVSAEVDTVGSKAIDIIHVTYHGAALTQPMVELVTNALQYFLEMREIEGEESY